jgi:dipeptidyl aminopeptidase/acylaminoacyl peptidase
MITENRFFYSGGSRISARVRIPQKQKSPAIVINHGYSGDKEEYDAMAEYLCERGFLTLQFDSRGCGGSEAQKGRMMCATEWTEDAANAVSYAASLGEADESRIGFTGCSMGGAITIYMAAMDRRVKCAVAMAPVACGEVVLEESWKRNKGGQQFEEFIKRLEADSQTVVSTGKSEYVSVPYALGMSEADEADYCLFREQHPEMVRDVPLESVVNSFLFFEPRLYASRITIPLLLIHGDADTLVSVKQSLSIKEIVRSRCELAVIKGAPHALPTSEFAPDVFTQAAKWFADNL